MVMVMLSAPYTAFASTQSAEPTPPLPKRSLALVPLEEISFMGPLRLSEIDAAKSQILETVRRLEAEGEINLEELRQKSRLS